VSARTKARKRAIDALFAADLRTETATHLLNVAEQQAAGRQNQDEIFGYARVLVTGVLENLGAIDDLLSSYAHGWSLERMPNLDRAILRVAAFEIVFADDVPDAVAIAEAVEVAKEYSTDDSGSFINGVLSKISARRVPSRQFPKHLIEFYKQSFKGRPERRRRSRRERTHSSKQR